MITTEEINALGRKLRLQMIRRLHQPMSCFYCEICDEPAILRIRYHREKLWVCLACEKVLA